MTSLRSRRAFIYLVFLFFVGTITALTLSSCAHKKKKPELTLEYLRDKAVALVAIEGAKEAKLQVETAIVNEIIENGRFHLIDRKSVQNALAEAPSESDWPRLGEALKADLLLKVDILEFKTDKRTGYDSVEEEDSLLSAEHRESRSKQWKKYYKVSQREGYVKLQLSFYDVASRTVFASQTTEASEAHNSRDGDVPRALKLLETLCAKSIGNFFRNLQ